VPAERPTGSGLVERAVWVVRAEVAFLRYVLEGHDGLALMHGDGSGVILLLAPNSQAAALDVLIDDLEAEGLVTRTQLR
jgi:hypothetical protein